MTIHGNKISVGIGTGGIETPAVAKYLVYKLLSLISNRSLTIYFGTGSQDSKISFGIDESWLMESSDRPQNLPANQSQNQLLKLSHEN